MNRLHQWYCQSNLEVAEVLDVSVGTARSRILRGRRLLREILKPLHGNPHMAHASAPQEAGRAASDSSGVEARHQSEAVLHSSLFSTVKDETSSRFDTAGWADPGKLGDAEGGV